MIRHREIHPIALSEQECCRADSEDKCDFYSRDHRGNGTGGFDRGAIQQRRQENRAHRRKTKFPFQRSAGHYI